MEFAYAHPFTIAADLFTNGTRVTDVKFVGVERFGNTGILEILINFFSSLF